MLARGWGLGFERAMKGIVDDPPPGRAARREAGRFEGGAPRPMSGRLESVSANLEYANVVPDSDVKLALAPWTAERDHELRHAAADGEQPLARAVPDPALLHGSAN